MPGPPDDDGTVRALLFGGPGDLTSGGGPPITIPAPDGTAPARLNLPTSGGLCTITAWPGGPVQIAVLTDVYELAPHQHASTHGRAPYRYLWAGAYPALGIP